LGTPVSQWTTALSCTLTREPIVTGATSPRTTAPNQKLASSPIVSSPVSVVVLETYQFCGVLVKSFIPERIRSRAVLLNGPSLVPRDQLLEIPGALPCQRRFHLLAHDGRVAFLLDIAEHAQRLGEVRVSHAAQ